MLVVRRLFVFLKENLLFDSLQDELEQNNLLTQIERDDYVCKDKCKYYRCERLLKLIIRKGRCNEFIALINNMPCYQHISEKIMEFRRKVNDQSSTGAATKTHSFVITNEMLEKRFALFYVELEPCEIADAMFQTGLFSISEHDDVTDHNQKHKRLRNLVDILKRKCLLEPFLSLLQSKKYTLLLDTLQNEREFTNKPSVYALYIQHNFTLLQHELPYTDDEAIVMIEHIFDDLNIADVKRCTGTRRKKSKILKILLMKGETACVEFFRVVEEDLKRKDLIQKMEKNSNDRISRGKPDLSPKLKGLEITCLQKHKEVLHNELDPLYLCDLLFEERAITILEHDEITEVNLRQKQIKYLLEKVIKNDNDCFHFFLYILQREDYKYIREKLERPASRAENVDSSERLELRLSHRVKKIQGDVPNEPIVVRLKVDGRAGTQVEQELYKHINSSDTEILENTISHGQIEITNVSHGSVVLQFRPLTDQAVQTLLNAKDNNRLLEMILGMVKKVNIAQILKSTEPMTIKLQVYSVKSADAKTDCQMSKTAMIIERVKAFRHVLVTQLEPKALASVLSKSKSFSESIKDTVNDSDSCYERVERILALVENGNNDIVEEFVTALNDLGYSEIVKLINPSDVHDKAENIRNMITSNYKNILEEMQMTLVIETLSKCIGRVDDIKEKCLPRNGNRKQRMNRFLQFILQDDHNVIEFEKMLSNNGLKELLRNKYAPEQHVSEKDIGEKKCTDKAYPLLLEQGAISTALLLKDKDLIMTHRTNPIYHQRQHLIKIESKIDVIASVNNFDKMSRKEVEKFQIPKKRDSKKEQVGKFMPEPSRTIRQNIQSIEGRPRITQTTESPNWMLQSPSKNPDVFISNAVSRQLARTEPKDGGQIHRCLSNEPQEFIKSGQNLCWGADYKGQEPAQTRTTSADTLVMSTTTSIQTPSATSKSSQLIRTSTGNTKAIPREFGVNEQKAADQSHQFSSNHSRVTGTSKQAQVVDVRRKKEGELAMEHVTMEGILQSLCLESCLMMFEENDLDYELLRDLSEEKLEKALTDIGLPLGKRLKISGRIQELKYQNTKAKVEALDISKATDAKVKASDSSKVNKASRKRENEAVRLVVIGKTGSGKSATGNTILGEPVFESTISGTSITRNCSQYFVERFGRKIVIVDTPGIFDTKENNEKIQEEIYKCIGLTSPGPHAFIFVINAASRYTEEEQRSVEHFVNYFGNEIYKYFIVLFVRKDELDDHKIQLTDHIRKSPPIMQQFIKKCGGRVCAFNNKARGREQDEQVKQLLQKILENIEQNGGNCYTNEMYKEAEKQIKIKEEERLAKEKAERQQQLQSIKQVIADDYNKKLAQERKNRELVQKNLDELVKKQNKDNNRIADLQSQIGVYKQMIIERRGDQQELKQTLDLMRVELAKSREASDEGARLIEKYKRDMEKSLEENEKLKRKHEIERQNLQREYEENIAAEREKIRDERRERMDEEFEEYKRRHIAEMEKRMK